MMKTGIELVADERQKQIEKHGFTGEHHAKHPEWYDVGQLMDAAKMLVSFKDDQPDYIEIFIDCTPINWDAKSWERLCKRPLKERIVIASALLASEIDRLNALQ